MYYQYTLIVTIIASNLLLIFAGIKLIRILLSIIFWHYNTFKICIFHKCWCYFSLIIFESNIFTFFRHLHFLFTITGKYRGSAHIHCNIKVKLNHKTSAVSHNLKNYDSHLNMQELSKFNFKINVIPNGLKNFMVFNINNKFVYINRFQFSSFSLDNVVKNLGKNDFKYLSWEFDSKALDLVKQK